MTMINKVIRGLWWHPMCPYASSKQASGPILVLKQISVFFSFNHTFLLLGRFSEITNHQNIYKICEGVYPNQRVTWVPTHT